MIFVTVGDSYPFDRLVRTVDLWAQARRRTDVFAQIGAEGCQPAFIPWIRRLEPVEFQRKLETAEFIVAHAGMGTILAGLSAGKPLLVLPRRAALNEMQNDHQVATAKHLEANGRLTAVYSEEALTNQLDHLDELKFASRISPFASPGLISALRTFIAGN